MSASCLQASMKVIGSWVVSPSNLGLPTTRLCGSIVVKSVGLDIIFETNKIRDED